MEGLPKQDIQNVTLTRRGFMKGGLAASAVMLGGKGYLSSENHSSDDTPREKNESPEINTEEDENFEPYNELSDSGYFNTDVHRFAEEFSYEVDQVMENSEIRRVIQENFALPNIQHSHLRQELEVLARAIGFVESRYKNDLSEVGAFGVMQLMPGTWEELARDGEDVNDIAVQVKVAARLMEQSYRHVMDSCEYELALIEEKFFGGNTKAFEIAFLTPLFINSYNAGMGSMVTLVREFIKICPTPAETVMLFDQSETLTGYDVFIGMSHTGNLRGWADWYKDVAANYTCKVYGAHTAIAEYLANKS